MSVRQIDWERVLIVVALLAAAMAAFHAKESHAGSTLIGIAGGYVVQRSAGGNYPTPPSGTPAARRPPTQGPVVETTRPGWRRDDR